MFASRARIAIFLLLTAVAHPCVAIWPKPQRATYAPWNESIQLGISPESFNFSVESSSQLLRTAVQRYLSEYLFPITPSTPSSCATRCLCTAQVIVASDNEELRLGIEENYRITVTLDPTPTAVLTASTVFGAMRALETFAQLVEWSDTYGTYSIYGAPLQIEDWPRFPWRGMMIDSGRHFLSMDALYRMVRTIAMNKMNVLHWHITDSQSFPLQLDSAPLLAEKGAYASDATYTKEQVSQLVEYARSWGVRVIPELDMPSHVLSWARGYPFAAVTCVGVSNDMIPFDPTNEDLYTLLDNVFGEIAPLFPDAYIHIGGDEVKSFCWERNETIRAWMDSHDMREGDDLWRYFARRLRPILEKHGWSKFVMWYEMFDHKIDFGDLNDTLTEVWMDPDQMPKPIAANRKTLLAGGYYLDRQVPDSHNGPNYLWVDTWVSFWRNDPYMWLSSDKQKQFVQGGEACMWGENVDSVNLDGRVWPRACGVSERLWSAPAVAVNTTTIAEARARLVPFRCRLARLGVSAGPVTPDYCPLTPPTTTKSCPQQQQCTCASAPATSTPLATTPSPSTSPPSLCPSPSPCSCPVPETLPVCRTPSPSTQKFLSDKAAIGAALAVGFIVGTAVGVLIHVIWTSRQTQPAYTPLRVPNAAGGDQARDEQNAQM